MIRRSRAIKRKIKMQNKISKHVLAGIYAVLVLVIPDYAVAQDGLDSGDTAWMLTSTALEYIATIF